MLSTTVTKTVALAVFCAAFLPALTLAESGLERLVATVQSLSASDLPALADLKSACGDDRVCAARLLTRSLGPKSRLEKVRHPTSDQIRGVTSVQSITHSAVDENGMLTLTLLRFGRKVMREFRVLSAELAASQIRVRRIVLDLRNNPGGEVDRALRVAGLFTGPAQAAVHLIGPAGRKELSVPSSEALFKGVPLDILVGPKTASSAEILAALLKAHADARLIGTRTYGKDYLHRVVAVTHDVRLLVPAERIEVPGVRLAGGLIPDLPALPVE